MRFFATPDADKLPRMTLLLVASSPSDLTELEGTARALARRGHRISLAYFYSGSSRQVHATSLEKLRAIRHSEPDIETISINVDRRLAEILAHLRNAQKPAKQRESASAPHRGEPPPWFDRLRSWMRANGSLQIYHRFLTVVRAMRRVLSRFMMLRTPTLYAGLVTVPLLRIYKSYASMFDTILSLRDYQAIVVPEDVVGPFWPSLIKTGLRHRIPTVILPYTLANREEAFKSLRSHVDFQTRNNRLAAFVYPAWRMRQDGYDIVRMPAGHIFVHALLGIAPPDPWMMNSGRARMICVDSQASLDYFLRAGIPADQLQVTGSVSQDQLAQTLRDKATGLRILRDQLGGADNKPLLLISGCPNQLAGAVPHCEFKDMAAVAQHLSEALRPLADHYHVVVRPHPNYPEFGKFMQSHGVSVSLLPTVELVPLCDLFIAFASATIRWAAACGIPTVNYDIFHYGYSDFAANKGVVTVSASGDFTSLLAQLRPDSTTYREARARSESDAAYWSVMDGRGLERIEGVIRQFARTVRT
jgi:hypothetical protein